MNENLPFAFSVFCDDIRSEIDGKFSFIGVYAGGGMFVSGDPPWTIPKFGISVTMMEPLELAQARQFSATVTVELPGDNPEQPSLRQDIVPVKEVFAKTKHPPGLDVLKGQAYIRSLTNFIGFGVTILSVGQIKVRIHYNDYIVKGGSLSVMRHENLSAFHKVEPA